MGTPYLNVESLTKTFGDKRIGPVRFSAERDEIIVILGPSGAGKSTLLRILCGLVPADRGVVKLEATTLSDPKIRVPPEQRDFGVVFQRGNVLPHLTAERNILLGRSGPVPPSLLRKVGLQNRLQELPTRWSEGEKQRLAFVRLFSRERNLYLLDEPLSNVDNPLRLEMIEFLLEHRDETRCDTKTGAYVYVTHHQSEALSIADKIVGIPNWDWEEDPVVLTPVEFYDRPPSVRWAGFVGDPPMHTFGCKWNRSERQLRFLGVESPVRDGDLHGLGDGEYLAGVRPERFQMSERGIREGEGGDCLHAGGVVRSVQFQGEETVLALDVNSTLDVAGTEYKQLLLVQVPRSVSVKAGVAVNVSWHPRDMRFYKEGRLVFPKPFRPS